MNKRQKCLLFLLVFAGTAGVLKVDQAYSDMMDQEGQLSLIVRRIDEENIRLSAFGESKEINVTEAAEDWERVEQQVRATLDSAVSSLRAAVGFSEESGEQEPDLRQAVFPVQTL